MSNELIPHNVQLADLSGTFDDMGQLIAYMRDLSKSLVPLADNLTDISENLPAKVSKFLDENPGLLIFSGIGTALIGGALLSSIVNNCLQIKNNWKK